MVQSTDSRARHNPSAWIPNRSGPSVRTVLAQSQVHAVFMVVTHVFRQKPFQVPLIEHDHMIEQISTATPHPAFGNSILPRASERRSLGYVADGLHGSRNFQSIFLIPVKDHVFVTRFERKRFSKLLDHPVSCRIAGHIAMQNASATVIYDEEAVENAKCNGRDREEIHSSYNFAVVLEKRIPSISLAGILWCPLNPTGNSAFRNIESELCSSPWTRGAPQVGFSATMRKMSSRSSLLIRFRPVRIRCRESQDQYSRKPARCQRTTVSGLTRISDRFQPVQNF
jgi:hypothetical protein